MSVRLITKEDLMLFKAELFNELEEMLGQPKTQPKKWLRSQEVRQLFGISSGTLQNYRINGTIPYTRLGKTFYYSREEIEKLLEQGNSRPKF